MSERRTWVPFLTVALIVAAGVGVILVTNRGSTPPRCAARVQVASPLQEPSRFAEDPHLAKLAAAVGSMAAPFGAVRAGVGFNYGQWLHLYGVNGGVLAFTKNNAPFTMLDASTLKPRWSLRPATKRIAWDASADRFALLDLSAKSRVRVGSYDLASGRQRWCTRLTTHQRDGDPVSTAFLDNGDLLVALPTDDHRLGIARLSGKDGHVVWFSGLERAGRADFLAQVDANRIVVGGVEAYYLATDQRPQRFRQGFEVLSVKTGKRLPPYPAPAAQVQHVVGVHDGRVLLLVKQGSITKLEAHDFHDRVIWSKRAVDVSTDAALRGGVVLVRAQREILGYSADRGVVLWRRATPEYRTYFPYGFTLDQMPALDDEHVLVPTTTSVQVMDVRTGKYTDYPLPTDGLSTTYWPYQLVTTDRLIGVVTNTGAVVAAAAG